MGAGADSHDAMPVRGPSKPRVARDSACPLTCLSSPMKYRAPHIGAQRGSGALTLSFGETGITGRSLEGPPRLVQSEREGFHRLAPRAEHRRAGTFLHGDWQTLFLQKIAEALALGAR